MMQYETAFESRDLKQQMFILLTIHVQNGLTGASALLITLAGAGDVTNLSLALKASDLE